MGRWGYWLLSPVISLLGSTERINDLGSGLEQKIPLLGLSLNLAQDVGPGKKLLADHPWARRCYNPFTFTASLNAVCVCAVTNTEMACMTN